MTKSRSRLLPVLGLLIVGMVLAGCGGAPIVENWPGLTLDGDTLYVVSGTPPKVYLLNAETGVQKTSFVPQNVRNGTFYWSPVTVADGLAYVGFGDLANRDYGLYTFDPETGLEQWHVPADNLVLPAPTVDNGTVYFGDSSGRVYAVDVATRNLKPGWDFKAGEAIWASPVVDGGRVYVASMDHHLYALEAETGAEVWSRDMGGALAAAPTLDSENGILYAGAFDARVHAVRADSGEPVDGFDFRAENWIWSEVLQDGDRLYVTSLDGRLYALDAATGEVVAPYPYDARSVAAAQPAIRTTPVQAGESIVIGVEAGWVVAVRDGVQQWAWTPPPDVAKSPVYTTPVADGERIYVVLRDGRVQALNASNGTPAWSFVPPEAE